MCLHAASINVILRVGFCPLTNCGDTKAHGGRMSQNRLSKDLQSYQECPTGNLMTQESIGVCLNIHSADERPVVGDLPSGITLTHGIDLHAVQTAALTYIVRSSLASHSCRCRSRVPREQAPHQTVLFICSTQNYFPLQPAGT